MDCSISELELISDRIRGKLVELSHRAKSAHLGSALSCVDILVAAYWRALEVDVSAPQSPHRDRLILSKGHAASALYTALAFRGFFDEELLDSYGKPGSQLEEHPSMWSVPGVEASTGSLGHGLSLGVGMALAGRIKGEAYRVLAVLSDGECNEGSVWEAAMFAAAQKTANVMAIVDFNKWQATGRSCEVMALESLKTKWESFGWSACEIDGHDMKSLVDVMDNFPDGSSRPIAVIAHTIKGKGVSFMEDDNNWHYRIPTAEEVAQANEELGLK